MTIQEERSKRFADCIKNLYIKGMYSIEYAILQLEKFRDNNKIIESDYEEYYKYFSEEMDKQNSVQVEEGCTENQIENGQNETEGAVENDAVDETVDTVQDKVIEENKDE